MIEIGLKVGGMNLPYLRNEVVSVHIGAINECWNESISVSF